MKELIILGSSHWSDFDAASQAKFETQMLRLTNYCLQAKLTEHELDVVWIVNSSALSDLLAGLKRFCSCPDELRLKPLDPAVPPTESTDFTALYDEWQSDLEYELERLKPGAAIECLAPAGLESLPILYYGLEASEADIDVVAIQDWYKDYPALLPWNHRLKAYTWLFFLMSRDSACTGEYESRCVAQQELFLEAAALAMFLHGFKAVMFEDSADFCFETALKSLPFDLFYLALSLAEEDRAAVYELLDDAEDSFSGVQSRVLRQILMDRAGNALASVAEYLGTHAAVFYTLWTSVVSESPILQTDRFEYVLNTVTHEKLSCYNYVCECELCRVEWD